mmetsp:Transcript_61278/g.192985  ORF Transcript_61278/g.192985 Transcript_61278/m.192985 type:complete len:200 (+) Transcript_61278:3-602(+)
MLVTRPPLRLELDGAVGGGRAEGGLRCLRLHLLALLPYLHVILHLPQDHPLHPGSQWGEQLERRLHNELHKAHLGTGKLHRVPVAERRHGQTHVLLCIPLLEEFGPEERRPPVGDEKGLPRTGDVHSVENHDPENRGGLRVAHPRGGLLVLQLLGHSLETAKVAKMQGHVRAQYLLDNLLPRRCKLFDHQARKEVRLGL